MAGPASAGASGVRSVAVAGDVSNSVIVTGDDVVVQLRVDGDDALLANLLTGARVPQRALRTLPLDGLPAPSPDHLDRGVEVQAVRSGVADGRTFEVHGPAEIGKTFVVTYALASGTASGTLPDGTVYVFAGGKPYGDVLQELHDAFYACEPPCVAGEQQIRRDLASRHALVVLDSLRLSRDEIRQLVAALPGCRLVLVARERPLGEGGRLALDGLALQDALALIEQELRRTLAGGERAAAEQLSALLGGHPFQLRQAAADVRDGQRSFEALVRALSSPPAPAAPPPSAAGDNPASAALAALLLAGLSEQEAAVVAQLAALRGATIGSEHVAALTEQADVAGTLRGLEARRLVVAGSPRYRIAGAMHDLPEPDSRALDRAIAYFAGWARSHRSRPERVLAEAPALLELIGRAAADSRDADVVALVRAGDAAFAWGRRWETWDGLLAQVLGAATRTGDRSAEAWARHQLGTRAYCLGDVSGAVGSLQAALQIREALGDQPGAAATRYNLDFIAAPPVDGGDRGPNGGGGTGGRRAGRPSTALLAAIAVGVAGLGAAVAIAVSGGDDGPPPPPPTTTGGTSTLTNPPTGTTQTGGGPRQFTLTLSSTGTGGGTVTLDGPRECRKPCDFELNEGTLATLTAEERSGSRFVGWTSACSGRGVCRVRMNDDREVTAIFDELPKQDECTNGVDDDADKLTDGKDPGCESDDTEAPSDAPPPLTKESEPIG